MALDVYNSKDKCPDPSVDAELCMHVSSMAPTWCHMAAQWHDRFSRSWVCFYDNHTLFQIYFQHCWCVLHTHVASPTQWRLHNRFVWLFCAPQSQSANWDVNITMNLVSIADCVLSNWYLVGTDNLFAQTGSHRPCKRQDTREENMENWP